VEAGVEPALVLEEQVRIWAVQQEPAFPVRVLHSQLVPLVLEQLTQESFLVLAVVQSRLVQ
jgi:hypothetical protein